MMKVEDSLCFTNALTRILWFCRDNALSFRMQVDARPAHGEDAPRRFLRAQSPGFTYDYTLSFQHLDASALEDFYVGLVAAVMKRMATP